MRRLVLAVAFLLAVVAASGCGFGSGGSSGDKVTVTVSRDFGRTQMAPTRSVAPSDGDTVMRLLQRNFTVRTRYGGGFVQEIDGVSGGEAKGRKVDWFYYVNGIEASEGAADFKLSAGDRVWWDHHDWGSAQRIPAVVGAFPEPFASGLNGKKLPVRLVCMGAAGHSCDEVEQRLRDAGIQTLARSSLEQSVGKVLRVLVGSWRDVRKDIAARQLEAGPAASGVFAKPDPSGARIALLDSRGQVQHTLGAAGGLVAATSAPEMDPTWLITGTDEVGVAAAAASITEDQLRDHFAIAIEAGKSVPLPIEAP